MLQNHYVKQWLPLVIFFAAYSALFFLFMQTLAFTLPFLIGLLVALLLQPLYRLLRDKGRFRPALASAVSVAIALIVLGGALFALCYMLISESSALISQITDLLTAENGQPSEIMVWTQDIVSRISEYLKNIDADYLSKNQQQLAEIFATGLNVAQFALTTVLNIVSSIPAVFTMLLVSVFSAYFFTKDYSKIKLRLRGLLSQKAASRASRLWTQGSVVMSKYVRSYLLIYFLTFVETLILFLVLGIPYPLVLSLLSGLADVVPILGPGAIYLPMAIVYLIQGDLLHGLGLLIGWLLISTIRQVVEPKIVSASLDVHPLAMLAVIFIGLRAGSFWLMIYLTCLLVIYKLLVRVEILRPIFPPARTEGSAEPEDTENNSSAAKGGKKAT